MKKLTALALCLLMLVSALLVSCNSASGDTSDGDNAETSKTEVSGDIHYDANLPEFSWDATSERYSTFKVAVTSNEVQTTYHSEDIGTDYETTDEQIRTAVTERNNIVKEKTGVEVVAIYVKDVNEAVQADVAAGTGAYDMAMPFVSNAVNMAQDGKIVALTDESLAQYLDFSQPWWNQNAVDAFSVSGEIYFMTGDITIMEKINTWAITFNKGMYAEEFPGEESLYDIVKDGRWTFDKLNSLAKAVTFSEDGVYDYTDKWGLVSAHSDPFVYYSGTGSSIVEKDADDLPLITFDEERSMTAAQKILAEFANLNSWHIYSNTLGTTDVWKTSLDIFGEGRALFRTSVFSAIKKLRKYENGVEFGILPIPKLDETQEDYYCSSGSGAFAVVIPVSAPDKEFSAYMTQLIAAEAKNYLTPAYYETVLKSRDMKDVESEEMLDDYVFANVKYDVGYIYNFGGLGGMFNTLASTGSSEIASTFESIKSAAEGDIEETVENYRS